MRITPRYGLDKSSWMLTNKIVDICLTQPVIYFICWFIRWINRFHCVLINKFMPIFTSLARPVESHHINVVNNSIYLLFCCSFLIESFAYLWRSTTSSWIGIRGWRPSSSGTGNLFNISFGEPSCRYLFIYFFVTSTSAFPSWWKPLAPPFTFSSDTILSCHHSCDLLGILLFGLPSLILWMNTWPVYNGTIAYLLVFPFDDILFYREHAVLIP